MRTVVAAFVVVVGVFALCAQVARWLAEAVHDDVPTAHDDDDESMGYARGTSSHGGIPSESAVINGRIA